MKRKLLRLFLSVLSFAILFSSVFYTWAANEQSASAGSSEIPYQSYTYWTDVNTSEKVAVYSKPMYSVKKFIYSSNIGGDSKSSLSDLAVYQGKIYILDGGLGRIYVLNSDYSLYKTVENVSYKGETLDFAGAKGIYVGADGKIYIADTENQRVIVTDLGAKVSNLLLLPDSSLIPTGFEYKPVKVAADKNGYIYIVSEGSYYGAILYSSEMEFLGFFGANSVKGTIKTVLSNIQDRLFSNDTKRAADELSLPYTITDLTVGPDDFIYTATGYTDESDLQTGQICMYNPGGKDVLKATDVNFADSETARYQKKSKAQNISGLAVDENGYMYLLDVSYGRIFVYDSELNILSVFGGSIIEGKQSGTFSSPTAIEVNGNDVIVTDSKKNGFTVFEITEYGSLVKKADNLTLKGNFTTALPLWQEINRLDGNNQLAYRGMAKAYYDMGDREQAMEYAYMGYDRETYGKAFKTARNKWIESHFALIAICIITVAVLITAFVIVKKKRNIIIFKTAKSKTLSSCVMHPVESFREIKEKGTGSLLAAFVLLILFYLVTVLRDTASGFIFTVFDSESYNSLYVLLSTVGLVVLWTLSNWLICTLFGGIGKLKEIFIVTCYCLIPIITGYVLEFILTHVLIKDEGAFLGIMVYALIAYAAFMLIIGIMRIHDYEFGKFVGTTLLTLCAMLVIIFLLFLVFMLIQQLYGWLVTVYSELFY